MKVEIRFLRVDHFELSVFSYISEQNRTVNKILNRNGFDEGNDTNQGRHVFLFLLIFWGLFTRKDDLRHHNIGSSRKFLGKMKTNFKKSAIRM
jgi:hypothetical protein